MDTSSSTPRYPNISVPLIGTDGNAFAVIGTVRRALHNSGINATEVTAFTNEAMAGDYDHLLQTCMAWIDVN